MGIYRGSQTGAVSASSPAVKGSYQITSTANTLEVGSLIQFTNHSKIYRVIGRTGNVLQLFPNLRENVQAAETILYNNLQGTFTLDIENEYKVPVNNIMSVNLKATEYL